MPTPVYVRATDPISEAGVTAGLKPRREIELIDPDRISPDTVAVIVSERLDEPTVQILRSTQCRGCRRLVLVVTELADSDLITAAEAGVCGVLRRCEASPEQLVHVIEVAASGSGSLPPDLIGRLLNQVSRLQRQVLAPRGLSLNGLTERETDVLRLIADGMGTQEIASRLAYSERTVKNVLHDVTSRLQLRNRSHAVAYALREGLI
jgi:DNA-binding NarL/FixJ family response regulator